MDKSASVLAKLSAPALARILDRERLYGALDALPPARAVWVHGPAGCGKTTLLAGYLRSRALRTLWYQLDTGDNDIATFFHYLRAALSEHGTAEAARLPTFVAGLTQDVDAFTRTYVREVFARARAALLVFDDAHVLGASSALNVVRAAVEEAPAGWRVLCTSRQPPPASFTRLIANGQLRELTWEQLRLTEDETRAIVLDAAPEHAGQAANLHSRVDGWVAGLMLELLRAQTPGSAPHLSEYLWTEVLSSLSPVERDLLVQLAVLPRVTARAAVDLAGTDEAVSLLERLYRQNMFVTRLDGVQPSYQFHPRLRDALCESMEQTVTEDRRRHLRRRAAAITERDGNASDAVELLAQAQDWPTLGALIRRHAPVWFTEMRHGLLAASIERLPAEHVDVWLEYWLCHSRLTAEPSVARKRLDQIYGRMELAGDRLGSLLAAAAAVETFLFERNTLAGAEVWIERLLSRRQYRSALPDPAPANIADSWLMLVMMMLCPAHPAIPELERTLASEIESGPVTPPLAPCLTALMFRYLLIGDLPAIERLMLTLRVQGAADRVPAYIRVRCLTFAAHAEAMRLNAAPLQGLMDEAFELARTSGFHMMDHYLALSEAYLALDTGQLDRAWRVVRRAESLVNSGNAFEAAHQHFMEAYCLFRSGDPRAALGRVHSAVDMMTHARFAHSEGICRLLLAQVLAELGVESEAVKEVGSAREIFSGMGCTYLCFAADLVAATTAARTGETARARAALASAFGLGAQGGYFNAMFWDDGRMAVLCAHALEWQIEPDYALWLIRKRRLTCPPDHAHLHGWPWPVRIYTLGRFEIVVNGEPLRFRRTAPRKPIELLKMLIALGGRGVHQQTLSEALWSESDGDSAYRALITTVQRVRRLLRQNDVVAFADGRLSLDSRICWVDSWTLERQLSAAGSAVSPELLEHYRGPFLGGDDSVPYVLEARERLRRKYLRTVLECGDALERKSAIDGAADLYEAAIEVEPLAEELYQRRMQCLIRLGRPTEALRTFEHCRAVLGKHLGAAPSKLTQKLAQSARK